MKSPGIFIIEAVTVEPDAKNIAKPDAEFKLK
jgi:hypothetical protein